MGNLKKSAANPGARTETAQVAMYWWMRMRSKLKSNTVPTVNLLNAKTAEGESDPSFTRGLGCLAVGAHRQQGETYA